MAAGHTSYTTPYLRVESPRHFVATTGAGSIGLAVGGGIGAAVARPGEVTIVTVGDAGFMMALAELDTAVRCDVGMVIVVFNDQALGAELQYLESADLPTAVARIATPSLRDVALAMGAKAHAIETVEDLTALKEELGSLPAGPVVLDCRIGQSVHSAPLEYLFSRL